MQARDGVFLEDLCPKLRARRWRRSLHELTAHRCLYCGAASESIDHVFPRSRGGLSSDENCVPACLPCNGNKGDQDAFAWYRSQSFYDPRRAMALRAWVEGDRPLAQKLLGWTEQAAGAGATGQGSRQPSGLTAAAARTAGPWQASAAAGGAAARTQLASHGPPLTGTPLTDAAATDAPLPDLPLRGSPLAAAPLTAAPLAGLQRAERQRTDRQQSERLREEQLRVDRLRAEPLREQQQDSERQESNGAAAATRSSRPARAERDGGRGPRRQARDHAAHQTRQASTPLWRWQMVS